MHLFVVHFFSEIFLQSISDKLLCLQDKVIIFIKKKVNGKRKN